MLHNHGPLSDVFTHMQDKNLKEMYWNEEHPGRSLTVIVVW
jgi:hypothetical protein